MAIARTAVYLCVFSVLLLFSAPAFAQVCSGDFNCGGGQYCQKAVGDCEGIGTCQPMGGFCAAVWVPVCGCDGATYDNSGCAALAGVNVGYVGECAPPGPIEQTVCSSGCDHTSIQAAIDASASGGTVLVHDGTYVENIDFNGKPITVYSMNGAASTTIDGGDAGSVATFNSGEGADSVLRGFTLTNGFAWQGGGIYINAASPTIEDCDITGNTAEGTISMNGYGGGIFIVSAAPTIRGCTVSGNTSDYLAGGIYYWGSPVIENCDITGNYAEIDGGGIFIGSGGGEIRDSRITGNTLGIVYDTHGGGIYANSTVEITGTVVAGNSALHGGGLYLISQAAKLVGTTVSGNSAQRGGGIYFHGGMPTMRACTIAGNSASDRGGAIFGSNNTSPAVLNSILWGNAAAVSDDEIYHDGSILTVIRSIVGGGDPGSPGSPWPGSQNLDADPLFVDGRPTSEAPTASGDYHLRAGSPAIDSGLADSIGYPDLATADIDGDSRPKGQGFDRGSDEFVIVPADRDGDGDPDIFWRRGVTGENYIWYMDGAAVTGGGGVAAVGDTGWYAAAAADFDGDGRLDQVWRHGGTGRNYVWYMNGTDVTGGDELAAVGDTGWTIGGTGDFDGDGDPDLLWRQVATGQNYIWYMDGILTDGGAPLAPVDPAWIAGGTADFDGDGDPDILWCRPGTGENYLWFLEGLSVEGGSAVQGLGDLSWSVAGAADFNDDGKPDILWRKGTGENYLWYMDGSSVVGGSTIPGVSTLWHPLL